MPGTFRSATTRAVQAGLGLWNRIPVRTQGRITVGLPLVAVVVSACLALTGNLQRVDIETDIQRKFEMTAALSELTTVMVDAETGVRGYQLTRQVEFLQPFDQATAELPGVLTRLTGLASAEPGEKPRADKLRRLDGLRELAERQLADLDRQRSVVAAGGDTDAEIRPDLTYGKGLMDDIRAAVGGMQDDERRLLDDRIAEINAIRVRDYVSVAVALVAALLMRFLAWYLHRNGILRRVDRLTDTVRVLRAGGPVPAPPPAKRDTLGELEREIHLLDVGGPASDEDRRRNVS
ncbi:CHASE3 domain-containing protein [Pseudonocardia oroxyli]|uniref:CHASE3 domain-containing protein n=1 Tax=Pseudonocardia oroxyli TaxID=366584 RepID=UPI0015A00BDB|nr:CHASE3 domain-containing protein [Pseudonocardia oroxyli]